MSVNIVSATFPELEHGSGSWIVTSPAGQPFELFHRCNAQFVFDRGWKVETAGAYLGRLNQEIRNSSQWHLLKKATP